MNKVLPVCENTSKLSIIKVSNKEELIPLGAILCTEVADMPKTMVDKYFRDLIERDRQSRRDEEDIYSGDFGSSTRIVYRGMYKGQSDSPIARNTEKFFKDNDCNFEKYVIDYAEVGQLGYVAVGFELHVMSGIRGTLSCGGKTFRNVTELKKEFNSLHRKADWLGEEVYRINGQKMHLENVGKVKVINKVYKSKPKTLPKKYEHLSEYIRVAYGAFNPF